MTIKYGKGYEETWAGFKGSNAEVRAALIDYFGVSAEATEKLSLSDLVVNVTNLAHGKGNVAAILGGVVIDNTTTKADEAQNTTQAQDPWAEAEKDPQGPTGPNPLYAQIDGCENRDDLKRLWAENQAAFADADLLAAWKARGKALTA